MTHDTTGLDANRDKELGQSVLGEDDAGHGDADIEKIGLGGEVGLEEVIVVDETLAGVLLEAGIELVGGLSELGELLVGNNAHSAVLGTLSSEGEGDTGLLSGSGALERGGFREELVAVGTNEDRSVLEIGVERGLDGDVVQEMVSGNGLPLVDQLVEALFVVAGEGKNSVVQFLGRLSSALRLIGSHDAVAVGASEAVGVAGDKRARHGVQGGELLVVNLDLDVELVGLDLGVQGLVANGGNELVVIDTKSALDDAGHSSSGFHVANIALHGSNVDGGVSLGKDGLTERCSDASSLDGIAYTGSSSVGLHVDDVSHVVAVLLEGVSDELSLLLLGGEGEGLCLSVLVDAAVEEFAVDSLEGLEEVLSLDDDASAAVGADESVALHIEGSGGARGGEHGGLREADVAQAGGGDVHAEDEGAIAVAGDEGLHGDVEGGHGAGAGRIGGEGRALEVEEVGDSVGDVA